MFKKTKLAAAVLAVVATSAQAVNVAPDMTGQVLIFPYYNVNNGFQTNLSITNTQNAYKIVKVRFRESNHSQDVLDFNIYMSPYDVWTGTVKNAGTVAAPQAMLETTDNTCTQPMYDQQITINGFGYTLNNGGWPMNTAYTNVSVTDAIASEGYIEVIEIGNIATTAIVDMDGDGTTRSAAASNYAAGAATNIDSGDKTIVTGLKHGTNGVPADCSVIMKAWTNGVETIGSDDGVASVAHWGQYSTSVNSRMRGTPAANASQGTNVINANAVSLLGAVGALTAPAGGLYGNAIYLQTTTGSAYVSDATAIDNYSTISQHFLPDDAQNFLLPSLASGNVMTSEIPSTTYVGTGSATVTTGQDMIVTNWPGTIDSGLNDGDSQTPRSGTNAMPIAHALAVNGIINDFFVDSTYNGSTDWVVTMPMKKHGIWNGTLTNNCNGDSTYAAAPNTFATASPSTDVCWSSTGDGVAYTFGTAIYDREEQTPTAPPSAYTVSPVLTATTSTTYLTDEVNVVRFITSTATNNSVLGSPNSKYAQSVPYAAGWAQMSFSGATTASTALNLNDASLSNVTVDDWFMMSDAANNLYTAGGVAAIAGTSVSVAGVAANLAVIEFDNTGAAATAGNGTTIVGPSGTLIENGVCSNVAPANCVDTNTVTFTGVPVIGFAAIRGDNALSSSYGETIPHKFVVNTARTQ